MTRAKIFFALTATLAAFTLTACNEDNPGQPPGRIISNPTPEPPSSTVSQPPTSTQTSAPATSSEPPAATTSTTPNSPGEAMCQVEQLRLSVGHGGGAAGTTYRPLIFTNVSNEPCVLHGFPGVSYTDNGNQVGKPALRTGSKGGPIPLKPGDFASAMIGFVTVQNYDPGECQPTPVHSLRIYPPQEYDSLVVPLNFDQTGCANNNIPGQQLTVQTMVAGTNGG